MARVIIFGTMDTASLAHFYLKHDSPHEVVGFTVDRQYLKGETHFEGLPLVPFEEIRERFPPQECQMFVPMTQKKMGKLRAEKYRQCKALGYSLISYVSSKATVWPGTEFGDNCFILEDNTIQPFTKIGNNVVMWSGNHIGHHGSIGDHVFVTSHVVISGHVDVKPYCFFGVNSTIRDAITVGEATLVGMGATITKSTDPYSVYSAAPASKREKRSDEIDF